MTVDRESPTAEGGALSRLLERARERRLPVHGSIELTRRCNFDCPYCYLRYDQAILPEEELSGEELSGLFDQFRVQGCLFLTFTGGEPLLRKDFREIYLAALRRGFLVNLFTNATRIDRETADFLAHYPPLHVDITILGGREETFDRVAGERGSFRRSREAVRLLEERGIDFGLKTVVSTLNRAELEEMKTYARRHQKTLRFDSLICPELNGSQDNLRYRLNPEEAIRLDREDEAKLREWTQYACQHRKIKSSGLLYGCGAGLFSFHVNSRGELGLCVLDTNYRFDLKQSTFQEAWRDFIPRVRAIRSGPQSPCGGCELRALCPACPAWSRLETGDPEKPVEFLCRIARLRGILFYAKTEKTLPET